MQVRSPGPCVGAIVRPSELAYSVQAHHRSRGACRRRSAAQSATRLGLHNIHASPNRPATTACVRMCVCARIHLPTACQQASALSHRASSPFALAHMPCCAAHPAQAPAPAALAPARLLSGLSQSTTARPGFVWGPSGMRAVLLVWALACVWAGYRMAVGAGWLHRRGPGSHRLGPGFSARQGDRAQLCVCVAWWSACGVLQLARWGGGRVPSQGGVTRLVRVHKHPHNPAVLQPKHCPHARVSLPGLHPQNMLPPSRPARAGCAVQGGAHWHQPGRRHAADAGLL